MKWFSRLLFTFLSGLLPSTLVAAEEAWDLASIQRWIGETAEGSIPYCQDRSYRWDVPFFGFDLNKDGVGDFIMPISCYQGEQQGSEKHNIGVKAAWKVFCSNSEVAHEDCTEQVFGAEALLVTGSEGGGGSPYTHVTEAPRDLNGDGYPDFWYALNRDDGRPGFSFESAEDQALLEAFCGSSTEPDCTRQSVQSLLLSNGDGSYRVEELPWGPQNTQAILILPNALGTFDVWAMIYGPDRVARLVEGQFIDVTAEYEAYERWQEVTFGNPYGKAFTHEGITYIAHADIPRSIAPWPDNMASSGFTLWRFIPGQGFFLSDFYSPPPEALFTYGLDRGASTEIRIGAFFGNTPVFEPRWHFFDFETLKEGEAPTLIVQSESFGQIGDAFQASPNPEQTYRFGDFFAEGMATADTIWSLGGVQGFYLEEGKLVPRAQAVVEGDSVWGASYRRYVDMNDDGLLDLVGVSGGEPQPAIFLNENGTLKKRFLGDVWPSLFFRDDLWAVEDRGAYGTGSALFPLYDASKLDLLYWTRGWATQKPAYLPESFVFEHGDIALARGRFEVSSLLPDPPVQEQARLEACIQRRGFSTDGFQESCLIGTPFPQDTDGDGALDPRDQDDDNDGVPDELDAFPLDALETLDTDADGIGNNADLDDDGDGLADAEDFCPLVYGLSREAPRNPEATADIERLEFCAGAGEPVLYFDLRLSGNIDRTRGVSLLFWLEGNNQTWITLPYESEVDAFRLQRAQNAFAANGTYAIRALRFTDTLGNQIALNEGQLEGLGFSTKTELLHDQADNEKPQALSLTTEGWSFSESGEPTITFTLRAGDDISGLEASAILELTAPGGVSLQRRASFNDSGEAFFEFRLSKFSSSGAYRINTIRLYDLAGNSNFSYDFIRSLDALPELLNPNSDDMPPALTQFTLSARFDAAAGRPVIVVKGQAEDKVSGFKSSYLRLTRPEGGILDSWLSESPAPPGIAAFSRELALTTQFVSGAYAVDFIRLQDQANNEDYVRASDLAGLGDSLSREVNVFFPTEEELQRGSSIVTAASSDDFVFGSDGSNDRLEGGDGNDYLYAGGGMDEVYAGDGEDLIVGGSGAGDDFYDGGEGVDAIDFQSASSGVSVDLALGVAEGEEIGRDLLSSIEGVLGSPGMDFLRGGEGADQLFGREGQDLFFASLGADMMHSGFDADFLVYSDSSQSNVVATDRLVIDSADTVVLVAPQDLTIHGLELAPGQTLQEIGSRLEALGAEEGVYQLSAPEGAAFIFVRAPTKARILDGLLVQVIGEMPGILTVRALTDSDGDRVLDVLDPDDDNDGLEDALDEFPLDFDNDGVDDALDAFPQDPSESLDTDRDGIGNNVDSDDDGDELADEREIQLGLDPLAADSDGDSVLDGEELDLGLDPLVSDCPQWRCPASRTWLWVRALSLMDSDGDGLSLERERSLGTDPLLSDTDADGIEDGRELELGTDPLATDSDGDSMTDGEELELGFSPLVEDCPSWRCGRGLPLWLLARPARP